jgi:hypothetical protein
MGHARRVAAETGHAVDVAIHGLGTANPHAHLLETELGLSGSYDPDNPSSAFVATGKPKNVKTYLVRDGNGAEKWLTPKQLRPVKATWAKVYTYADGVRRTKAEAMADGMDPTKDRKSASPVSRVTRDDGESSIEHAKAELVELRAEWAREANWALAEQEREDGVAPATYGRIDHRSNAERGMDAEPTAHEGCAVRGIEARAEREAERDGRKYEPVTDVRVNNLAVMARNDAYSRRLSALEAKARYEAESTTRPLVVTSDMLELPEARRDIAAAYAVRDDLRDEMTITPAESVSIRDAYERPRAAAFDVAGRTKTGDVVADALDEARSAVADAEDEAGRGAALTDVLARLRSFLSRVITAMAAMRSMAEAELCREQTARERERTAREAMREAAIVCESEREGGSASRSEEAERWLVEAAREEVAAAKRAAEEPDRMPRL